MSSTRQCPSCGTTLPKAAAGGLCPRCLLKLGSCVSPTVPGATEGIDKPTATFDQGRGDGTPGGSNGASSFGAMNEERFLPGTILAGRYRIVSRLGSGGMGEVYRADDLKLGHSVALKFLPEEVQTDRALLERLLEEVKLARQVAHPNVCRVYDVGEVDGQHFLTMEYIDGEDLSSLLKRIGRAPQDKAVQIAWQLCAGLAAIHAKGILHCDLKPANVMVDSRGQVRITDFGVAGQAVDSATGRASGTPLYMAPEQLAGRGATMKSDLYSLGLVLFETFTGRRVFRSPAMREREQATPPDPALLVETIDPAIGALIHRCLEPDPADRPRSAHAVLAALPAVDPLQAALVAGETPSPELVAEAGERTRLDQRIAATLMGLVVAGSLLLAATADDSMLFRVSALEKAPEVLADRARGLLRAMGYERQPTDTAYGFGNDASVLDYLERQEDAEGWDRLARGRPAAMYFWYRESSGAFDVGDALGKVTAWDPPVYTPGTLSVVLDPRGRLLELHVVPAERVDGPNVAAPPDWAGLFEEAALDPHDFAPTPSRWIPPVTCNRQGSWDGFDRADPGTPIHIEAGTYAGRPVFFHIEPPWRGSVLHRPPPRPRSSSTLYNALYLLVLVGCGIEARRNLRQGRGDRKGARRLAVYVFSITLLVWLLQANHAADLAAESRSFIDAVSMALYTAFLLCWVPYIALEPHIRRSCPEKIVTWTRLLAGRFRDPLVGRDLLIGVLGAVVFQLILPTWLGHPAPRPDTIWPETLLGPRSYISAFLGFQDNAVFLGFAMLFLLFLVRFLVRNEWLAAIVVVGVATTLWYGEVSTFYPALSLTVTALRMAGFVFVLKRFGVLAAMVAIYFDGFLNTFPVTIALGAWYAESSVFALTVVIGLGAYALYAVLGGRPFRPVESS
jgi:predicted Ser/Thr protein kinase